MFKKIILIVWIIFSFNPLFTFSPRSHRKRKEIDQSPLTRLINQHEKALQEIAAGQTYSIVPKINRWEPLWDPAELLLAAKLFLDGKKTK
jgi:hypothetical protein